MFGDQVGGQTLENVVELTCAFGLIIFTASQIRDLCERLLVNAPAEKTAASKATAKKVTLEGRVAKGERGALVSAKANGVDADASVCGLLRGIQRPGTGVAGTIGLRRWHPVI